MAAQEKHGETQRNDSPKDPAYGGSKHANDLRGSEPDLARMVWVLQAQQSKCLWERRRLRARTTAQHPEKAKQKERARTRKRSSALAKCLLHHHGLVYLKTSTRGGMSIFLKVTTNWRAGCKKSACPVRREGRSFPSSLPLSGANPPPAAGRRIHSFTQEKKAAHPISSTRKNLSISLKRTRMPII